MSALHFFQLPKKPSVSFFYGLLSANRPCFTLEAVLKWESKLRNRIGANCKDTHTPSELGSVTQCSHSHRSDGEECKDRVCVASSFPDAAPLLQNLTGLRLLLDPPPTAAKNLFPCECV